MPTGGYYVWQNILKGPDVFIVFTTGFKYGGGHCYFQYGKWDKLIWSHIPDADDLRNNYTYYKDRPKSIPKIDL